MPVSIDKELIGNCSKQDHYRLWTHHGERVDFDPLNRKKDQGH